MFPKSKLKLLLLILVIHITIPVIGLSVYGYLKDRAYVQETLSQNLLTLTRTASKDLESKINSTEGLLKALSSIDHIKNLQKSPCQDILKSTIIQFPGLTVLGATNINGEIICSSQEAPENTNVSDRLYFKNAVANDSFSAGEYIIGRITNKPNLPFAYPIHKDNGQLNGVIFTGVSLDWINNYLETYSLPSDIIFTILDVQGTVLARTKDSQAWVGKSAAKTQLAEYIISDGDEGNVDAVGIDGTEKTYAYKKITLNSGSKFYLYVGAEKDYLDQKINLALTQNALPAGITIILVLIAAFIDWKIVTSRIIKKK